MKADFYQGQRLYAKCEKCGGYGELDRFLTLTSLPPQKTLTCFDCKENSYVSETNWLSEIPNNEDKKETL